MSGDAWKLKYYEMLNANFSACREKNRFCDVKLKVGEKIYNCHRLILASNSKYFMAFFEHESNATEDIISLSNEYVDEKSFSKLLDAMYGETFRIEDDWIPLFTTSTFLQLTHFIDQCEQYVVDNLESIDLMELIMLPELKLIENLYCLVKKNVCHNFPKYCSRLAGISLDVLQDLLSDSQLFAFTTNQLFDFCKNWIIYDLKNRKQHLQLVASLLKPFHTSREPMSKLISKIENLVEDEYGVGVCLKTLLETPDYQVDDENNSKSNIPNPLCFIKPNDESEVLFGTYENGSWVFLNDFQVPISTALLQTYDGAVANDILYFVSKPEGIPGVTFYGCRKGAQEWTELMPPRQMPQCLIPCNSALYLYEHSRDDYQFSFFEPTLNRWLKVPAVNYPRRLAGIATDNQILYMVGGEPLKTIALETPSNIIEMYDSRCGNWSRVAVVTHSEEHDYSLPTYSCHKQVCYADSVIYLLDDAELVSVDVRFGKKVLDFVDLQRDFDFDHWHMIPVMSNRELWIVNINGSSDIEIVDFKGEKKHSFSHPNVFVRPIHLPYLGT